jgi:predicted RNA binding protein YcfA (HicA-like mRNA interferase family)
MYITAFMLYSKERALGNTRAKDIIKKLVKSGFLLVGQKGSHKKYRRGSIIVIIPDHGSKDLGRGLIKAIEKQSGVKLLE